MDRQRMIQKVMGKKKGTFFNIAWESEIPVYKRFEPNFHVTKRVVAVVRCGVDYDNMANTVNRRMQGLAPTANTGLPWGHWYKEGYIIEHNNRYYLRCYLGGNNVPDVTYYLNGRKVNKEDLVDICSPSKLKSSNKAAGVMSINMDNIIMIG